MRVLRGNNILIYILETALWLTRDQQSGPTQLGRAAIVQEREGNSLGQSGGCEGMRNWWMRDIQKTEPTVLVNGLDMGGGRVNKME